MTQRFAQMFTIGVAAALSLSVVATAGGQARSTTRIPIVKESPGEVITRVDTVMVTRVDTLRVYVNTTDTVRVAGPVRTVTRYDTVTVELRPRRPEGFYFGLGGGALYPGGSIDRAQMPGYAIQAQIGTDPWSYFGVQFDVAYAGLNEMPDFAFDRSRPQIWNFNLDLKGSLPLLGGWLPNFQLYALGGATYMTGKNLLFELDDDLTAVTLPSGAVTIVGRNFAFERDGWHGNWGWNAGGGVSVGWNNAELFVESRFISFSPSDGGGAHQVPFVVGLNWY